MFSFGGGELLLIGLIALLLFGPDKVPELARTAGKVMREIKKYKDIMDATIREQMYIAEHALDIDESPPTNDLDKMTQAAKASYDVIATQGAASDAAAAAAAAATPAEGDAAAGTPGSPAKPSAAAKKGTRPSAGGVVEAGTPKRARPKKRIATDEDEGDEA